MPDRKLLLERLERLAIVLDDLMPECAEAPLKEQESVKPIWGRGRQFGGACGLQIRGGKFCSESDPWRKIL